MSKNILPSTTSCGSVSTKETIIDGKPALVQCFAISGQTYTISQGLWTVARLEDEWYEDVQDPEAAIHALQASSGPPDLFTFWQRIPDCEPKYPYPYEWEEIAVLPVTSYQHWLKHQIKSRVRNLIRKAEKEGVVVKEASYDEDFVRGMTAIFNETPVRQGRRFWHYGKDFDTVKDQFSRYLFREHLLGAYYQGEMIGFMMLGNAGRFGITAQIISSIRHRDKAPNNALIAKAVEVCEKLSLHHLIYLFWTEDSLAEFKRRCGFQKIQVPRYYVPLTFKGRVILRCGMHRGLKEMVPQSIKNRLKSLRSMWYKLQ